MKPHSYLTVLLLAFLTVFSSCKKEDDKDPIEPSDNLEQYGILGKWKLDSREYGGISDGAVMCCDTLEFKSDIQTTDLKGLFRAVGAGYETSGAFELDVLNESIEFTYDDEQKNYGIIISDSRIVFNYSDNNESIVEHWIKK